MGSIVDVQKDLYKKDCHKKRDESTTDEKTQDPKFAKELAALFKRTEPIKHNRADSMVFPIAGQTFDAQSDRMSPTLALLVALTRDILNENAEEPWIYSTWVNVTGIMNTIDESPAANRGEIDLPGLLFPSQVANLMLVEREDLMPFIAPSRGRYLIQ